MVERWMVWVGFLIVVAIGLSIGFYDWRNPMKIFSKAKAKKMSQVSNDFGNHVFSSKTLRNQDQKDKSEA